MTSRRKNQTSDVEASKAVARQLSTARLTCEGCASLRKYPRPMCSAEASPNYRQPRDTHQQRCAAFNVTMSVSVSVKPEAPPMSRGQIDGEVPRLKRKRVFVRGDVSRRMA